MPRINLLPWREELRSEKQRQLLNVAAGAAVVMLGIVVLVHLRMAGEISNQDLRNEFLQQQIVIVEKEIEEINTLEKEKADLLARMKVIQELQGTRPLIVHLFDEIAKNLPEPMFLLSLSREGETIKLEGISDSNDYVSQLMRNLNTSPWLTNPRLSIIESGKKEYPDSSWFQLTVSHADTKQLSKNDRGADK